MHHMLHEAGSLGGSSARPQSQELYWLQAICCHTVLAIQGNTGGYVWGLGVSSQGGDLGQGSHLKLRPALDFPRKDYSPGTWHQVPHRGI